MMRRILRDLEWGIAFVFITLALFLIIALLTIKPVIATVTETYIAPGQIHCRSEQILTDDSGHKWDVMFFTEADSPEVTSLNLRLSGLYSSANIQSQLPLKIGTANKSYEATDIFLENPPLPSIGQYNLKNIFPRLSTADLTLEIPLENNQTARIDIPRSLFEEWQQVADRNYHPFPKLPYTFEFMC
ncbi:DUF3122 domain-containing protein [Waterburya agarophytonicola K14]|uniref:DUF3122 domain-containing protein n=1 Tax=Waterburya agarophytonicola KI4 TaxID=2874699 RepID=A0A964FLT2_9CYAN|nr:DUF3122 domain-containing protein [Waterburya agarophytonicola]MCC0179563.1 DUF3122 domain-containing protein [Waterburya agarophytonicola KI4]